ncbi:MAG: heme ABC transporter substrate-binding protein IsdE [Clostridiales Family XIII bacterium]|jgi:iron complex transport system substrate-binding protein|nr:heme ABC transporter substrate-binding protein IsdE [Clostridiales Family XIII bacterium]
MSGVGRTTAASGAYAPVAARLAAALLIILFAAPFAGCVDQHPKGTASGDEPASGTDAGGPRIVATSMATVEIMDRLGAELIGVPHSDLSDPPERYKDVPEIGMPMSPDIERIKSMKPDYVFSPSSLEPDLKPKYEAAGLNHWFLDLKSVDGMYASIETLGDMLGKEAEATALAEEYRAFLSEYQASHGGRAQPRVLVLMGLPGSYIVATDYSYVGSLVKMAGGLNVYADETEEFIAANTEDMLGRDPDVIVRAAHALPDDVVEMFAEEFAENDIWRHFRAVEAGRVYDLPYKEFGMSATFLYPDALKTLDGFLYADEEGAS